MTTAEEWLEKRCGADHARLSALYADLAVRKNSDRSAFEAGVEWWRRLLCDYCLAGLQRDTVSSQHPSNARSSADVLVLRADQALLDRLTIEEIGRPIGIGTVLNELKEASNAFRPQIFLSSAKPIIGPSKHQRSIPLRALSIAATPLIWAMSQLSVTLGLNEQESDASENDWRKANGDWVLWDNVEDLTNAVLSMHQSRPKLTPLDKIYSQASFKRELVIPALQNLRGNPQGDCEITERDLRILIVHLTRDKKAAIADEHAIKISWPHDESTEDLSLGEHEKEIVKVRETSEKLERQVQDIEARIKERQGRIEQCLRQNSKNQALSYLRSRKALEALRDKRAGALEVLHGVLLKIEQAASDVEVMKAYESSTASLKTLLRSEHLQPDRIEASMDAMQESLSNADEIRQAIELGQDGIQASTGAPQADQDDIEQELEALQMEVEREKAQASTSSTTSGHVHDEKVSAAIAPTPALQETAQSSQGEETKERRQALAA